MSKFQLVYAICSLRSPHRFQFNNWSKCIIIIFKQSFAQIGSHPIIIYPKLEGTKNTSSFHLTWRIPCVSCDLEKAGLDDDKGAIQPPVGVVVGEGKDTWVFWKILKISWKRWLWFPEKNCGLLLLGEKSWTCSVFTLFSWWQLWVTREKLWIILSEEKSWKCWGYVLFICWQLRFPEKNCRFTWLRKKSWKRCGFTLFSCWQLWFPDKMTTRINVSRSLCSFRREYREYSKVSYSKSILDTQSDTFVCMANKAASLPFLQN